MELRQLRTLVAVADEGTFTDAAVALGVSQAAVSRTIAALESALGTRLVRRTTRHAVLTPAGAQVVARARRILTEVEELQRVVGAADELRLGYAWSALGRHTLTVQRRWAERHPEVPLVLVQSNTSTAGLADGTVGDRGRAASARPAPLRHRPGRHRAALRGGGGRRSVGPSPVRAAGRFRRSYGRGRRADRNDHHGHLGTGAGPAAVRDTHSVDEWLTLVAAGRPSA
jgi:DNA-binding transcriptional LysR family regulator